MTISLKSNNKKVKIKKLKSNQKLKQQYQTQNFKALKPYLLPYCLPQLINAY
jgi:hypothetical protein